MKHVVFFSFLIFAQFSFAQDPPCEALIVGATQRYSSHKEIVDESIAPVLKDMRAYLKTIKPQDRKAIADGLEGIDKLSSMEERAKKHGLTYKKKPGKTFALKTDWEGEMSDPLGVPGHRAHISHVDKENYAWTLAIKVSTVNEEEAEIKKQIAKMYELPPFKEYLKQKVPASCLKVASKSKINSDDRSEIKDVKQSKKPTTEKAKSGATKS